MQKRSKQVLKDGRLRTRLRRSISSGPDNNIKPAARGSPGREMEANSDRETGEMGRIGIENGPLLSLAAALRANGAAIPLEQATPMTSFDLVDWARGQDMKEDSLGNASVLELRARASPQRRRRYLPHHMWAPTPNMDVSAVRGGGG